MEPCASGSASQGNRTGNGTGDGVTEDPRRARSDRSACRVQQPCRHASDLHAIVVTGASYLASTVKTSLPLLGGPQFHRVCGMLCSVLHFGRYNQKPRCHFRPLPGAAVEAYPQWTGKALPHDAGLILLYAISRLCRTLLLRFQIIPTPCVRRLTSGPAIGTPKRRSAPTCAPKIRSA